MDDILGEGFESGSQFNSWSADSGIQGSEVQPERYTLFDDAKSGDSPSSEGGSEYLESGNSFPDGRTVDTVSESGENGVWVRSMIQAHVTVTHPVSGNSYVFPTSGSEVKVETQDVNWLLEKRQTSGSCCGVIGSNLAFELV